MTSLHSGLLLALVLSCVEASSTNSGLRLGVALNPFNRYGFLSISVRVVPRNDSEDKGWMFREPTIQVFSPESLVTVPPRLERSNPNVPLQGDFHLEFCDSLRQLLQAYFRDFSVEGLDRPWKAFSGGWSRTALARYLGMQASYASPQSQHCYVLVRVTRPRSRAALQPDAAPRLTETTQREADRIQPGDVLSVSNFVRGFGSHYVAAYATGNALFQVFVYSPEIYSRIKIRLKSQPISKISKNELTSYFSPWFAEHIGTVQTASGNASVEAWASNRLRNSFYFLRYANLLNLHGDAKLLAEVDGLLSDEAVVQLDLKSMSSTIDDPRRREWFSDVVDNYLKLWEVNM